MALDLETALSQYGLVGLYAKNNPEINNVLKEAIDNDWDAARFERALWDTNWWKQQSERKRQLDVLRVTDPASYNRTLNNQTYEVGRVANSMGFNLGNQVKSIALLALQGEWSEEQLRAYIVDKGGIKSNPQGGASGQAGEVENHLRQVWTNYGLPLSDKGLSTRIREVLAGRQTVGGVENEARAMAMRMYPQFGEELNNGQTIRDIADPYVQTMANTLELPETQLTLADTAIKKALSYRDPKSGKPTVKPLWEFERELKNDPRWDKTKQARNETYAILQQIGQDWGFSA